MTKQFTVTLTDQQASMIEKMAELKDLSDVEMLEYYLVSAIPQKTNKRVLINQINVGLFNDLSSVSAAYHMSINRLVKHLMIEKCDEFYCN